MLRASSTEWLPREAQIGVAEFSALGASSHV